MESSAPPVSVTIGGTKTPLPPMTFGQIKRVLPHIEAVGAGGNRFEITEAALAMVAEVMPDKTANTLGEQLLGTEIDPLLAAVTEWMVASGLIRTGDALPGEALAVGSPPAA